MKVERKKYALLALLVGAITILGVMYVGDNPDWTLPVSVRAQEIENLSVDIAAQTLDHVDINIKSQSAPVDINVTNSELDVNVTNSTLNVNVQGTANVEIQNAELNVQTLKEQASAAGKVATATWSSTSLSGDEGSDSGTLYTNNESSTVYVEMITHTFHALSGATSYGPAYQVTIKYVFRHSNGSSFAVIYSNPYQVLNFDPAIPLAPGDYVEASVVNRTGVAGYFHASIIVRKS